MENASPLTTEEWAKHYNNEGYEGLVRNVKTEQYSVQTQELLKLTNPLQKVLEIGSGSGETSLALQRSGRVCTALDFTKSCLDLTTNAARILNLELNTVLADATKPLPFKRDHFDVIFQAGLLEHFEREERIRLLNMWGKVGHTMISIIPNSASIAYRFGMSRLKRLNKWEYGLELPQYTMQEEFRSAGFRTISEYTIGEDHALSFLPRWHPVRLAIRFLRKLNTQEIDCHQGYLLVTVGSKIE